MGASQSRPEKPKTPLESLYEKQRHDLNDAMGRQEHADDVTPYNVDVPVLNPEEQKLAAIDPTLYDFPFENVTFEGGGNKGLSYAGAIQVLEEAEIRKNVKRIAGTSIGAITAAFMAIGFTSAEIMEFMKEDIQSLACDGWKIMYIHNILNYFGLNPAKKLEKWFKEQIGKQTGDPEITFAGVYEQYNVELCIVTTNVNDMHENFCHVKTTPQLPIWEAVRASMSFPFLFQPVKATVGGKETIFVDGGLLCNNPVKAFDGWWLSLNPDDCFLEKMRPLEDIPKLMERRNRFGTRNEKTLGFILYSADEHGKLMLQTESRTGVHPPKIPDTKLGKKYKKKVVDEGRTSEMYKQQSDACQLFFEILKEQVGGTWTCTEVDRKQLDAVIEDERFTKEHEKNLFGDVDPKEVFDTLEKENGKVNIAGLVHALEYRGSLLSSMFQRYGVVKVDGIIDFIKALSATLINNAERIYSAETDADRIVGINTAHVGTTDFKLEQEDIDCIVQQGRDATLAFLRLYVDQHNPPKKKAAPMQASRKSDEDQTASEKTGLLS